MLADQLSVKREVLEVPLALQLAVQGSCSKVNTRTMANLQYQTISKVRSVDIINISNYDLILGTPWIHQHKICIGFNPARVVIGSNDVQPLKIGSDRKLMMNALTPED